MKQSSALSGYRVLDLTDEKGFLAGKILADLGADVIKIEDPSGDRERDFAPFVGKTVNSQQSLYWLAFNLNKRDITLQLDRKSDREVFRGLVERSHFLIESRPPGNLAGLGLDYASLSQINPALVMVSITDFGQTGPYNQYQANDMIGWGMGGLMFTTGDPDRAPLQVSFPQSYPITGVNAAVAALIAHHYREKTGKGQWVDLSVQASVLWYTPENIECWPAARFIPKRSGSGYFRSSAVSEKGLRRRLIYPCKDGFVTFGLLVGGPAAPRIHQELATWMESPGFNARGIRSIDWQKFRPENVSQESYDSWAGEIATFFRSRTKTELLEGAIKRGIILCPVSTPRDLVENPQLVASEVWARVQSPEESPDLTYPCAWAKLSATPCRINRPAPSPGEHNVNILKHLSTDRKVGDAYRGKTGNNIKQPFEDLLVIDFGWAGVGPIITKYLAEHGAIVIKIESEKYPDTLRVTGPYKDNRNGLNRSLFYACFNPNKYGVTLNLNHPRGRAIARQFVEKADIVVENFQPGTMARWGLNYEELVKINPDIIMVSASAIGRIGPYSNLSGYGFFLAAYAGFSHLTGWPDRECANIGPFTDFVTAHFGEVALLACLDYRNKTGKGQHIELSQLETGLQVLAPVVMDYLINGREWQPMGNRSLNHCPHGAFRCTGDDAWCTIAVCSEEEWQSFKTALDNPVWIRDDKFATFALRKENEESLERLIEAFTVERTPWEMVRLLQSHGVRCGMVQDGKAVFEDAQLNHRENRKVLSHPEIGTYPFAKEPFIFSETPSDLYRAAPCVGEHNEYVYTTILGLSDAEMLELMSEGII